MNPTFSEKPSITVEPHYVIRYYYEYITFPVYIFYFSEEEDNDVGWTIYNNVMVNKCC